MKNRFKAILILIIMGVVLVSCRAEKIIEKPDGLFCDPSLRIIEENQRDGMLYSGPAGKIDVVEKHSKYIKFDKDKTKLQNADAVEYIDSKIYIADAISHEIAVFDLEGNRLKTIGKEGKEAAEFRTPVDIFYHAGHAEYYVLDAGNQRVQVFNLEDEFVKEIYLGELELSAPFSFQSVSVDNDKNIYIAPLFMELEKQKIYKINKEGEVFRYPDIVSGSTIMSDGKIYYFDTKEIFITNDPSTSTTVIESSGKSNVYQVMEDTMRLDFSFPHRYSPSSILIDGDKVYAFSSFHWRLDMFKVDGNDLNYQHSLTKQMLPLEYDQTSFSYDLASTGSHLILAEKEGSNIYLLDLEEKE